MSPGAEQPSGLHLYDRIVAEFQDHQVDFLIVGAYAVVYHGFVRATDDFDIFIRSTPANARRTVEALKKISEGEMDLSPKVFTEGKGVSLGERPLQVDILSQIDGMTFDQAWEHRTQDAFGPATAYFISREDLITNKKATGRSKDLIDVEQLEKARGKAPDGI